MPYFYNFKIRSQLPNVCYFRKKIDWEKHYLTSYAGKKYSDVKFSIDCKWYFHDLKTHIHF